MRPQPYAAVSPNILQRAAAEADRQNAWKYARDIRRYELAPIGPYAQTGNVRSDAGGHEATMRAKRASQIASRRIVMPARVQSLVKAGRDINWRE